MSYDLLSVLAWLAGPGLAAISAFVLEQLQPVQELSPNGKIVTAITVAAILGLSAVLLQQLIGSDSALIAQINPYMQVLIPLVSILVQQLTHGSQLLKQRTW